MTIDPPLAFLTTPLAHRGLHDLAKGRPENSLGAFQAAIDRGYGIELDVQLTSDDRAMVFHDGTLDRLTGLSGLTRAKSSQALRDVVLSGSREKIPTLSEVLTLIDGRVPLLIEIKDQDGQMGPDVGPLEASVASEIRGYTGPLAVMSFNPHSVAAFKDIAPGVPIGLTTSGFDPKDWAGLPEDICAKLRGFPDFGRLGASFISHDARDLTSPDVHALRDKGIPVLCWTIRSSEQEKRARIYADNITFEGYLPDAPKP